MPSGELLDKAMQSGEGGWEGKNESLQDYALKNKLKCHPHIKKHCLAVTINFLTETRPTVSKCFNLPIATICKGAGSNGFAIKTKTGKEIAKLAKELICKPWSQDYKVFMNMLITRAHCWEWLVGENTGFAWSKSLDLHGQCSRCSTYFPQLPGAGEHMWSLCESRKRDKRLRDRGSLYPPVSQQGKHRWQLPLKQVNANGHWDSARIWRSSVWN